MQDSATLRAAEATLRRIQAGAGGLPPGLEQGLVRLGGVRAGAREATRAANERLMEDTRNAWVVGFADTGVMRSLTAKQILERYPEEIRAQFGRTVTADKLGRGHIWNNAVGLPRNSPLAQQLGPDFSSITLAPGLFLAHKPATGNGRPRLK